MRKALLASGILASAIYIAANVVTPLYFPGYEWTSQTVSELSAVGAQSRSFWLAFVVSFGILQIAFGVGILMAGVTRRSLQIAGWAMVLHGIVGFFWPPMHLRGAEFTLTDALHIAFTVVTVPLMMVQMVAGAWAQRRAFRIFSIASVFVLLIFGMITGIQAPDIAAGLPTPFIGISERISIAAYIVWLAAFSLVLLANENRIRLSTIDCCIRKPADGRPKATL